MRPLCQTCANIFRYPECCTEKLGDSVTIKTHCGNYSGASMPRKEIKEQLGERFHLPEWMEEEPIKPEIDFNLLREPNGIYSIQQNILAMIINEEETIVTSAIYAWAKEKGYDDVLLMDEGKLKEIIALGSAEYERLHGKE